MSDIKKRKITQTTMLDLSSELLEEILLRVPAKSLALMKLTCKQCKTLIEDPNFVEKHFSRMRGREQQLTVITEASPDANSSSSLSSSSGFKVSCMGIDLNRLKKPCLNIKVFVPRSLVKAVFECDGLLVWVMEHNLLILNPLLRRGKIVSVPPPRCGYDYCNYAYSLGYVTNPRSSNEIVKFSCKLDSWVYDFKSQSWNEVFDKIFDGLFNVPMSSVCFRGTPYWTGICKRGTAIYSIQSLDFERECFEPLLLPPTTFEWGDSLSLGVFKVDYISLLHRSSLTGEIHLWVKKQQWSMMMTVVIPEATMFHMHSSYLIENNSKLVVIAGSHFEMAGSCHFEMAGSCHFETKSVTIYVAGENEEFQKVEYLCGTNSIIDGCYCVPSLIKVPGFSG